MQRQIAYRYIRPIARGAFSATATFYSAICIVLYTHRSNVAHQSWSTSIQRTVLIVTVSDWRVYFFIQLNWLSSGALFTKVRTPIYVRKFWVRKFSVRTLFAKRSYVRKIVNSCVNVRTVWAVVWPIDTQTDTQTDRHTMTDNTRASSLA